MKVIPFWLLLLIVCFSTGCNNNNNEVNTNSNLNKNETINNKENVNTMKVIINDKSYEVELFDSVTKNEIINMLPLELTLQRYAEHEYYSELPTKPTMDENTTSNILAGDIYYWDGWNAFVINYEDYDITPYKVVHIGEIKDKSIVDYLRKADKNVKIKLEVE